MFPLYGRQRENGTSVSCQSVPSRDREGAVYQPNIATPSPDFLDSHIPQGYQGKALLGSRYMGANESFVRRELQNSKHRLLARAAQNGTSVFGKSLPSCDREGAVDQPNIATPSSVSRATLRWIGGIR